jgi:hypothetical protein
MNTLQVTKLEKQVLEALASCMYAELGFSDAGLPEVCEETGLSPQVVRGVASSLVKKGYIVIDDRVDEGYKYKTDMHIWYLTPVTLGLVEHWIGDSHWTGTRSEVVEMCVLQERDEDNVSHFEFGENGDLVIA